MLVCHCHRVTDRTIKDLVKSGCRSGAAVGNACGAGTACGGCSELVELIVRSEDRAGPPSSVPSRGHAEAGAGAGA
jgi:bacterioferritin-associated ferredoxin